MQVALFLNIFYIFWRKKKHAKSYIYIDNKKTAVCAICLAKELLNVDQRNLDSCVIILLGLTNVV